MMSFIKKCKHFKIYELVSKQVYEKYGETAWQFFDPRLLENLDWIRETTGKKITVNDWYWGGNFDERGLRCNMDTMMVDKTNNEIIYCSPHPMGQGVDFDEQDFTAQETRDWLRKNQKDLPHPIRVEKNVSWVHIDVRNRGVKYYEF